MSRRVPRRLPSVPDQFGVATTAQALAGGWTPDGLRHAVRTGAIDRLWRGMFAPPVAPDAAGRDLRRTQLAVATSLGNPGALVSHLTSAAVYTWPTWAPTPQACVTHDRTMGLTRTPLVHVHRAHVGPLDRWSRGALAITSPARTVCDIAREHGLEAGQCAADAAAHRGDLRRVDLHRSALQARDWPGGRGLEQLVEQLDPRAESVLETRSRFRMPLVGIPPPMTQALLYDLRGRLVARLDFFWPEFGVVGEADGRGEYDGFGAVLSEKDREDTVRRLRLTVVRWGWDDLAHFDVVAARFWQAVADQAPFQGAPRRWTMSQLPTPTYRHAPSRPVPALVVSSGATTTN